MGVGPSCEAWSGHGSQCKTAQKKKNKGKVVLKPDVGFQKGGCCKGNQDDQDEHDEQLDNPITDVACRGLLEVLKVEICPLPETEPDKEHPHQAKSEMIQFAKQVVVFWKEDSQEDSKEQIVQSSKPNAV